MKRKEWLSGVFFFLAVPVSLSQAPIEDNPEKKKTFTGHYYENRRTELRLRTPHTSKIHSRNGKLICKSACMHTLRRTVGACIGPWCVKRASRFTTSISGVVISLYAALGDGDGRLYHEASLCDSLSVSAEKKKSLPAGVNCSWTSTKQTHVDVVSYQVAKFHPHLQQS